MNNPQTDGERMSATSERSASEQSDDVTGNSPDARGTDAKTNHEQSTGADGEPPAAAVLSDGMDNCDIFTQ